MNIKRTTPRERVNQDLELLAHFNREPDERALTFRRLVRGAAVRTHYASGYSSFDARSLLYLIYAIAALLLSLIAAAPELLTDQPSKSSEELTGATAYASTWILNQGQWVILGALVVLTLRAWMNGSLLTLFGGFVVAGILFVATNGISASRLQALRDLRERVFGFWVVPIAVTALLLFVLERRFQISERSLDRWGSRFLAGRTCKPLDVLALRTLRCAAYIHTTRKEWTSSRRSRIWCKHLEVLARQADAAFSLMARTPRGNHLRPSLQADARRLAAVIRDHQRILVTAKGVEDVDQVVNSLINGSEAMLKGNRAALLLRAEPDLPRFDRFKALLSRWLPGVILLTIGTLLPRVPISIDGVILKNMQWVLILAGIVSLVSANKEVTSRINDTFTRGVTWKS